MTIDYYISQKLNVLLEKLVSGINREYSLEPLWFMVPNQSLSTWLKLGLARHLGISANFEVIILDHFYDFLFSNQSQNLKVVNQHQLEHLIRGFLISQKDLPEPLKNYLNSAGKDGKAFELRWIQLSAHLAQILTNYQHLFPDMLNDWLKGKFRFKKTQAQEIEVWQSWLWKKISGLTQTKWLTLPEVSKKIVLSGSHLPKSLSVFGISHLSKLNQNLFETLATKILIHIYAFAPSRDWLDKKNQKPTLANLWGKLGHESLRSFERLTPKVHDLFVPKQESSSLLGYLQSHLNEEDVFTGNVDQKDESIKLIAAPSIRREVEEIAGRIWHLLAKASQENKKLRFDEIAILIPPADQKIYQAHIEAVFAKAHKIPCSLEFSQTHGDPIYAALKQLFSLPLSDCTREDLLNFLTHPSLAFEHPEMNFDQWTQWCDSLGIFHGLDQDDHKQTYIKKDLLNWSQGLRRLSLSTFMAPTVLEKPVIWQSEDQSYHPISLSPGNLASACAFIKVVQDLISLCQSFRKKQQSLSQWCADWSKAISNFFVNHLKEGQHHLIQILKNIDQLATESPDDRHLSGQEAFHVLESLLARLSNSSLAPSKLTDGVIISSLRAVDLIPFKAVFVVGLKEDVFDSPENSSLDLREFDPTTRQFKLQEDKYSFLKVIISTKEHLTLSWVSQDAKTGSALRPASVIFELTRTLQDKFGINPQDLKDQKPLWRHQSSTLNDKTTALAESKIEKQFSQIKNLKNLNQTTNLRSLPEGIQEFLDLPPLPEKDKSNDKIQSVSISALKLFLTNPIQGWAKTLLKLREEDSEDPLRHHEIVSLPQLPRINLLREIFAKAITSDQSHAKLYDELTDLLELEGRCATGQLGLANRDFHLSCLKKWTDQFDEIKTHFSLKSSSIFAKHHFGYSPKNPNDVLHAPLTFDLDTFRVQLIGTTDLVNTQWGGILLSEAQEPKPEHYLKCFVDLVILGAAGAYTNDQAHLAVLNHQGLALNRLGKTTSGVIVKKIPGQAEAQAWLKAILEDLFGFSHDYFLPFDVIAKHSQRPHEMSLDDRLLEMKQSDVFGSTFDFGPLSRVDDYDPPANALEIAKRRFDLYLAQELEK